MSESFVSVAHLPPECWAQLPGAREWVRVDHVAVKVAGEPGAVILGKGAGFPDAWEPGIAATIVSGPTFARIVRAFSAVESGGTTEGGG